MEAVEVALPGLSGGRIVEWAHVALQRGEATSCDEYDGQRSSEAYEESIRRRDGGALVPAAKEGLAPEIKRRWPTLQTGQKYSLISGSTVACDTDGRSLRQCSTIRFRMRLERKP